MNRRILIVDDNKAIHEDFRKILVAPAEETDFQDLSVAMFGDAGLDSKRSRFEIDSACQGQEGLERVREALAVGRPYALAFVDVRMPPGWDGIETIARVWEVDADIQIVICTAYSDHSWEEIAARVGGSDKLVILKKPFDVIEVQQLAHALTRKWSLAQDSKRHLRELDQKIQERTRDLRESETRYRALFENMLEGFAYCRMIFAGDRPVDFTYLEVNKAFAKLTGLHDVVGKKLSEILPGLAAAHPELLERYGRVSLSGQPERFEIYLEPLQVWLAISVYSPSREHFVAAFDNITDRKKAEVRLAAFASLDHRLSAANTAKAAAHTIVEVADQLIGWDACLCDLYNSAENIVYHVLSMDLIKGQRRECDATVLNFHAPSPLAKRAIEEGGHLVLRRPDELPSPGVVAFGDPARPSASILYVPIRNGPVGIGVLSIQSYTRDAYDLHDLQALQALADRCSGALERIRAEERLRETQEQLRHSQKLEGIGQLAGGVAHDFNNLLVVIRGNAELVLLDSERYDQETQGCLKQVAASADRAANLTRQLLAFSRKQVMQTRPLNLNDVIANIGTMLKRLLGETIQLQCTYAEKPPFVRADIGMLEQVLVNLVVNARDAMPRGGQVVLATETVTLDRAYTHTHLDARPGEFVCCSVRDTGTGIPPEHLPHIFDPFFTTKEPGKGTGLGLSTVYGIVKQHLGWVEVSSALGTGSTFKVFLPVMKTDAAPANTPQSAPGLQGGGESILLVEDEDAVRSVARRFLSRSGYSVIEAVSGRDALEQWGKRQRPFDLLVTDMVMPGGLSGVDLARRVWAENPDLKVIFMSGYSAEVAGKEADFLRRGQSRFVQKPWPPGEFLNLIRKFLDEKAEPVPRQPLSLAGSLQ